MRENLTYGLMRRGRKNYFSALYSSAFELGDRGEPAVYGQKGQLATGMSTPGAAAHGEAS